jgi:hypothetical protein
MTAMLLDTQVNSKDIKNLSKNIKDIEQDESGDFFEQIIAGLLEDVENENTKNFLLDKLLNFSQKNEKNQKLDIETLLANYDENKKLEDLKLKIDFKDAIESGEVIVEELLKLSFMIKNDIDTSNFKTDSKELKVALDDKKVLSDFKNAKNIKDLFDIAKKNDIDVKNFEFFIEEKALNPKDKKIIKNLKSEDVFKIIDKKIESSPQKLAEIIKNDNFHKENTLKNLLASLTKKNSKNNNIVNNKQNIGKVDIGKSEVFISKKSRNIKTTESIKNFEEKVSITVENELGKKVSKKTSKEKKVEIISSEIKNNLELPKNEQKELKIVKQDIINNKSILNFDNINKKVAKSIQASVVTTNNDKKENENNFDVETNKHQDSIKIEHTSSSIHKVETQKIKVSPDIKHTLNTFAQDFKEQVESYKPPLMKVKMQLNPKGLGDVDVTMVNRGNNLHITVNSNPNTIAIFSQNQTEFKNSLVSMGFSELNMSFNENGKNQSDNQKQKNKNGFNHNLEEETNLDSFEIVTPMYI